MFSRDVFQNSAFGNRNHHDAGGDTLARRIPSGEFQRVTEKQLFQPDGFTFPIKGKPQGAGAETADRPRRYLQCPHAIVVDTKLRMDWTMRQAQRSGRLPRAFLDGVLRGFGKSRRCDVDRFFEVWTLERIGLIEDRQNAEDAIGKKSFDRNFLTRNVTFDEHLIEIRLASGKNLRGFKQAPDARSRREKLLTIVGAHNALTR